VKHSVEVTLCGVRGSIPAPGHAYCGVGGHTSCVAIGSPGQAPRLILDAGTGIQNVITLWGDDPFQGTVLLTHLHWDHVYGIPFFRSADREDARTTVGLPRQKEGDAQATIDGLMSPPYFPIDHAGLLGEWRFCELDEGRIDVEGCNVLCREIPHKGGRTFGFRVEAGGVVVSYLPDHSPCVMGPGTDGLGELHEAALELAQDADLLIHGGQFTGAELARATLFGHATMDYAIKLASGANVSRLLLTHHHPLRNDEALAQIEEWVSTDRIAFAREGDHLTVAPRA
jgi:phosphoribosyl 1,2-cyclic phosphodiesterase